MKKICLLIIMIILLPINVYATTDSGKNSIVMDIDSGRILYQKDINSKHLIASTTKIMTSIVAMDKGTINKKMTARDEVLEMYGTSIYLEYKEQMKLEDLLYGLLLRSGNDAAVVIANNISKSEKDFVKLMNKKAKEIGMNNTIFENCHGLDEKTKNYSTAKDMAILSSYAMKNYPLYRKITNTYKYAAKTKDKSYLWYNRNKLLKTYKYTTGGKTGYTPSAGKTFVSTAKKDRLSLTAVTLNDPNTFINHKNLYETIFNKYKYYKIVDKNNFDLDNKYIIKESFSYPLTMEEKDSIKTLVKIDKKMIGEKKGVVEVYLNNKVIKEIPIIKNNKKEKKNNSFFKNLFS